MKETAKSENHTSVSRQHSQISYRPITVGPWVSH